MSLDTETIHEVSCGSQVVHSHHLSLNDGHISSNHLFNLLDECHIL